MEMIVLGAEMGAVGEKSWKFFLFRATLFASLVVVCKN